MHLRGWLRRVFSVLRRGASERELDEEIRVHLEYETEKYVRAGMSVRDARRRAMLAFGGVERFREETRAARGLPRLQTIAQDLDYAMRMLVRTPSFSALTVLTLTLGIGGGTAIFTVVNAVLLRPPPYADASRLMLVWRAPLEGGTSDRIPVSFPDFTDWRARNRVFDELSAFANTEAAVRLNDETVRVQGAVITAGMFRVLGISPALGRGFLPEEDTRGRGNVVILSHDLWQRAFASDPGAIGSTITAEGRPYTVVGVMPAGFRFLAQVAGVVSLADREYWIPFGAISRELERGFNFLTVLGRLRPGVSLEAAQVEMAAIARALEQEHPDTNAGASAAVVPLADSLVAGVRTALLLLLAAVGVVLAIACANVSNLLLARAETRGSEIAIRLAIGASRSRLMRQLFTESLLLALLGGAGGVLLALVGVRALVEVAPAALPRLDEITVDVRVLGFALMLSLATSILFGLAPALSTTRPDVVAGLKESRRAASTAMHGRRFRSTLVVSEMALALVLLIGAGLLMRSYVRVLGTDAGFRPDRVLVMSVPLPSVFYPERHQSATFYRELLARIEALPGVRSAGAVSALPLSGTDRSTIFHVVGRPVRPPSERPLSSVRLATPDYFPTLGIALRSGRMLQPSDGPDAPPVALINETMALRHFAGEDPIGELIRIAWSEPREREIVGVVNDVRHYGLDIELTPEVYLPYDQEIDLDMTVVVSTAREGEDLAGALRRTVATLDASIPVDPIQAMEQILSDSVARRRFNTQLLGLFALIALALALSGIYGVISYSVTQRLPEMGIRMALGADRKDILRLVIGEGVRLAGLGVVTGLAAALFLTRLLTSLLYGVGTLDPFTFVAAPVLLTAVGLAAAVLPASRASHASPALSLRAS